MADIKAIAEELVNLSVKEVQELATVLRWAVKEAGIPLTTAVKCAAVNPAKSAGIYEKYGSITPGKAANLVLLRKEDLSMKSVILNGEVL